MTAALWLDLVEEVDAEPVEEALGLDVELEQLAGPDEHAHDYEYNSAGRDHGAVVALDGGEGAGHALEGQRGGEEGDREAGGVEAQQDGPAAGGLRQRGRRQDGAQGRADAG